MIFIDKNKDISLYNWGVIALPHDTKAALVLQEARASFQGPH